MNNHRARRFLALLPLILLLLAPRPASAQFSGAIQGTITDSQKAVVADAVVMVTHTQSGVTRESVTTSDGVFRVLSLGPGVYRVEVVKPGFLNALREQVTVGISETVRWTSRSRCPACRRASRSRPKRLSSRPSRGACPDESTGSSSRRCRSAAGTSTT